MCGVDDVYFPVPILVNRMDTTAGEPLVSQQWACFACCALGCGFDNSGSTCATRNYVYVANGTYGCTKCGGGDVKNPGAGTVKTSFQDFSTKDVYSVITQPYQGELQPK